jgi:hypothetical protein
MVDLEEGIGGRAEASVMARPGITVVAPTTEVGEARGRIWGKRAPDKWPREREREWRLTVGRGTSRVTRYQASRVEYT